MFIGKIEVINLSVFANMDENRSYGKQDICTPCLQSSIQILHSIKQDQLSLLRFHLSAYSHAGDHSPKLLVCFFDQQMFRQDVVIEASSGKVGDICNWKDKQRRWSQEITYCQYTVENILTQLAAS